MAEGIPRGGCLPPLCEGRLRSGAVPPPTAAHWAGCWDPPPTCCGRGCVGVGAQHCLSGLHAMWGLRAAGVVGGCPRGGALPTLRVAPVVRRSPSPGRPSSGAGCQGSATRVSRVRSVRALGPSTGLTACALAGRPCSLWRWREGVPGGGACNRCEGRLVSGAAPPPATHPLEWAARVPRPGVPGAVGAGVETQHRPHSVRPCGPALLAGGVAEWRLRGGRLPPL